MNSIADLTTCSQISSDAFTGTKLLYERGRQPKYNVFGNIEEDEFVNIVERSSKNFFCLNVIYYPAPSFYEIFLKIPNLQIHKNFLKLSYFNNSISFYQKRINNESLATSALKLYFQIK